MFAVDDELESSPKHEALDELPPARRARAFEAWLRLGAACRKRGNGGLVTAPLAAKVLHAWKASERAETLADLVVAKGGRANGLLVAEGGAWRFHEWDVWQPDEEEAAEERVSVSKKTLRQRRWRHSRRHGVDDPPSTEASTQASTVDASEVDGETPTERLPETPRARSAPATRALVPDPVPIPTLPITNSGGVDLDQPSSRDPSGSVRTELKTEAVRAAFSNSFRAAAAPLGARNPPWLNGLVNDREWGELRAWLLDAFPDAEVETAVALGAGFAHNAFARKRGYPFRGGNGSLMHGPGEFLENGHAKPSSFEHVKRSALERLPEDSR